MQITRNNKKANIYHIVPSSIAQRGAIEGAIQISPFHVVSHRRRVPLRNSPEGQR